MANLNPIDLLEPILEKFLTEACFDDVQCVVNNSTCAAGICGCSSSFTALGNEICLPVRTTLGEPCMEQLQCYTNINNSVCDNVTKTCKCSVDYYSPDNIRCIYALFHCGGEVVPAIPITDHQTSTRIVSCDTCVPVLDVDVILSVSHTYFKDLEFRLEYTETGSYSVLRESGCNFDGYVDLITIDEGGTAGNFQDLCNSATSPPSHIPSTPLSVFNGLNSCGTWNLSIYDNFSGDSGTLEHVELVIRTGTV
ncbi:unnamed protein product [Cyprideis torosa]|uniref:Uncharacterized protein n=1 Tax=Cyprideis torosa TaxID=163714 RepID=A0A7R8WBE5_9CRUS|nr:unnamed protein product [Cyprideis torosa]CAG0887286.1 unnamed protein product [Cyprideis torosa]